MPRRENIKETMPKHNIVIVIKTKINTARTKTK